LRSSKALAAALVAIVALTAACSEATKQDAAKDGTNTTVGAAGADCAKASVVACAPPGTILEPYLPKQPTKAVGSPVLIGTINQDTGAAGAFPELTVADKVAVDFINTELGGIDGHPIELITCNTNFSPDLSQSCAQEMVSKKVAAVIGGIDVWGTGIKTLENNGIPYIGGIPVSFDAARSKVSFQFSGGVWGAVLGMGKYAMDELNAKKIAIIYGDFGSITDAAKLGETALENRGAEVTLIPVSAVNADMVTALNQAAQGSPDVVIALTADSGCKPTMQTADQIDFKVPIMYTGACAATKILDAVGDAAEGSIFNLEAELDPAKPDNELYQAIAARYGPKYSYEAQGAGTVSFRAVINLYTVLRDLGYSKITPAEILRAFRNQRNAPSFFGHPYTCDGKQLPGYGAMCAPQQSLGELKNGKIKQLTDWIDVRKLVASSDNS
jgi:branched-chain amino acid transport system substrate-binding protein